MLAINTRPGTRSRQYCKQDRKLPSNSRRPTPSVPSFIPGLNEAVTTSITGHAYHSIYTLDTRAGTTIRWHLPYALTVDRSFPDHPSRLPQTNMLKEESTAPFAPTLGSRAVARLHDRRHAAGDATGRGKYDRALLDGKVQ